MTKPYDSRPDTVEHMEQVRKRIQQFTRELYQRELDHDASKLVEPEKSGLDVMGANLRGLEYGSEAYKAALAQSGPLFLDHHYAHNRHHPEYWSKPEGEGIDKLRDLLRMIESSSVSGPEAAALRDLSLVLLKEQLAERESRLNQMTLVDIVEMFCDWAAASQRTKGGSVAQSLPRNQERWGISPQLIRIFENTAREFEWP